MTTHPDFSEDIDFTKNKILQSDLDDDYKKILLHLINVSYINPENLSEQERHAKISDALQSFVLIQAIFLQAFDEKMEKTMLNHCEKCPALNHAKTVEKAEHDKAIIEKWKQANNIDDEGITDEKQDTQKSKNIWLQLLLKPYVWIFASIIVFSPYTIDIIKILINAFQK